MATLRQKMLQGPLLLNIATRHGISARPKESDWDDVAHDHFSNYSDVGGEIVDREKFKNEAQWARHQLAEHGLLTGEPRVSWEITDSGLKHLRLLLLESLKVLDNDGLDAVALEKNGNLNENFLLVLRHIPPAELFQAVQDSRSIGELLLLGLQQVPVGKLESLLTDIYEIVLDLFWKSRFRLSEFSVQ